LIGERARLACIYACKKFTSVSRSDSFGRIRADITMQGYYSRARREMLVRIITERSTSPPPLSLSLSLSLSFSFLFSASQSPASIPRFQWKQSSLVRREDSRVSPARPPRFRRSRDCRSSSALRPLHISFGNSHKQPLSRRNGALRRGALHRRGEIRSDRSGRSRVTLRARTRTHARTHACRSCRDTRDVRLFPSTET